MKKLTLLLLLPQLLFLSSCKKEKSIPILTTFNGVSDFHKEVDGVNPQQIGAKYYAIEPIGHYTELQVILTENGNETVLATQKIDSSGENNAASLHIQHSHNQWIWFVKYSKRGSSNGIHQGEIPQGWHIAHATSARFSGLKKPTELLDTFYLAQDNNPFKKLPLGTQNYPDDSIEQIKTFTKDKSYFKAISIILKK